MRITRIDPTTAAASADPIFVGRVTVQPIVTDDDTELLRVTSVTFHGGARNRWHQHGADQVLVVTEGRGIIATDEGERPITVGNVVLVPAGERHWHGAAPGATMSHLSILTPGTLTVEEE
jgi:quercetin dioxygenase-like cupin family protein